MRALALIKGPPPPLVARPRSSPHRSRSTFAPMLAHLGALGRHLGANMSQHRPKMRSKMRSWSQHRPKRPPRRLNRPPEPRRIAKNLVKYDVFLLFLLSDPCGKMVPKSTPNLPKIAPKTSKVEPQVAILAPTWAKLGRSGANFTLP